MSKTHVAVAVILSLSLLYLDCSHHCDFVLVKLTRFAQLLGEFHGLDRLFSEHAKHQLHSSIGSLWLRCSYWTVKKLHWKTIKTIKKANTEIFLKSKIQKENLIIAFTFSKLWSCRRVLRLHLEVLILQATPLISLAFAQTIALIFASLPVISKQETENI